MCGVVGVVGLSHVNQLIYDALTILQHRGQDAAGIATYHQEHLFLHKSNGLVSDVLDTQAMESLIGHIGIGHVRYPTAGSSNASEAQPFYVNSPYGISLSHNGNLTNSKEIAKLLYKTDLRHINTSSDSEVLLNVFAHELQEKKFQLPSQEQIFKAVTTVHKRCQGGYAAVSMINGFGLVAFRDPYGIRPLVYGVKETPLGNEYMIASESAALNVCHFKKVRDIAPGEAIIITEAGDVFTQQCASSPTLSPCLFEYVYFARADSILDNISVYKARLKMGEFLALKIMKERPNHDIDVVISIPETSRPAALQLAYHLDVKYREGFMKNRYIGRTFIMPGQEERKRSVKQKLSALELEFSGKNVLLVDDSIVRGTTCQQIIEMAREAGAKNVYFASAAPIVRYPNVYGIDMPSAEELIGHNRSTEDIRCAIGADWLIYQDLDDLIAACLMGANTEVKQFDCSVFNGQYITGNIEKDYLKQLSVERNDRAKKVG